MKDFIKLMRENISIEKERESQYKKWKPIEEWEDNPKIKQGIQLEPGEWITRRLDNNKLCSFCGEKCYISPSKLCKEFKEIVYPSCDFCKKSKIICNCALGKLQEQWKYL